MRVHRERNEIVPRELLVGLALVGLMLLGAVLYGRAVNFQRFLEPMLATLQPQRQFAEKARALIRAEFGERMGRDVVLRGDTVIIRKELLSGRNETIENYRKLARVFEGVMSDQWMRSNIDFVLISAVSPFGATGNETHSLHQAAEQEAASVLAGLMASSGTLSRHSQYFTSAAFARDSMPEGYEWVSFRIVASERLHIEMLQRLEKYLR